MCSSIRNLSLSDRILTQFSYELITCGSIDDAEADNREQQLPTMHIAGHRLHHSPSATSMIEQNDRRTDTVDISVTLNVCQPQRMLWKVRACEHPSLEESASPIDKEIPRMGDAISSYKKPAFWTGSIDSITFFRDYRRFQSILMRVVLDGR